MHGAPRDLPTVADEVYGLSEEEWGELRLAFTYGQRLPTKENLEDIWEFRTFYRRLEAEKEASSRSLGGSGEAGRIR